MKKGTGQSGPIVRGAGFDSHSPANRLWRGFKDFSIGGDEMNAVRIAAIVLIVAGILGLVYGNFSYTKETHETKLGPLELSVKDKQTVNIPVWGGVGAIVIGGALLVYGSKKS